MEDGCISPSASIQLPSVTPSCPRRGLVLELGIPAMEAFAMISNGNSSTARSSTQSSALRPLTARPRVLGALDDARAGVRDMVWRTLRMKINGE